MRRKRYILWVCAALGVALVSPVSEAGYLLEVTEVWPGNQPGNNLTGDWFEVTNRGNAAWIAAQDGSLWFDDLNADVSEAVALNGVSQITAGGTAVFVKGDAAEVGLWRSVWNRTPAWVPVGFYDGDGLAVHDASADPQAVDGVTLFIDAPTPGVSLTTLDDVTYPDANDAQGRSWDVTLGAFSQVGNASNAYATEVVNDAGQRAIGSPGQIPEPASLMLVGLGVWCLFRRF